MQNNRIILGLALALLAVGCRNYSIGDAKYVQVRDKLIDNIHAAETNTGNMELKKQLEDSHEFLLEAYQPYELSQIVLEEKKMRLLTANVTPSSYEDNDNKVAESTKEFTNKVQEENLAARNALDEAKATFGKIKKTFESLKNEDTPLALALQYTLHYTNLARETVNKLEFISDRRKENIRKVLDDIELVVKELENQKRLVEILQDDENSTGDKISALLTTLDNFFQELDKRLNDDE
jgi:chromosome segregation ATPase